MWHRYLYTLTGNILAPQRFRWITRSVPPPTHWDAAYRSIQSYQSGSLTAGIIYFESAAGTLTYWASDLLTQVSRHRTNLMLKALQQSSFQALINVLSHVPDCTP